MDGERSRNIGEVGTASKATRDNAPKINGRAIYQLNLHYSQSEADPHRHLLVKYQSFSRHSRKQVAPVSILNRVHQPLYARGQPFPWEKLPVFLLSSLLLLHLHLPRSLHVHLSSLPFRMTSVTTRRFFWWGVPISHARLIKSQDRLLPPRLKERLVPSQTHLFTNRSRFFLARRRSRRSERSHGGKLC